MLINTSAVDDKGVVELSEATTVSRYCPVG